MEKQMKTEHFISTLAKDKSIRLIVFFNQKFNSWTLTGQNE